MRDRDDTAPRSIRDAQKESTYQLLVEASEALFVEKGYVNTSIGEITSRAGASRATFYLHFESKWRAVSAVCRARMTEESRAHYERLDALDSPTRADIRGWIEDGLDFYHRHRRLVLLSNEAMAVEPEFAAGVYAFTRGLVDLVPQRVAQHGPDRSSEIHLRLSLLITQLASFAAEWVAGMWDLDRAEIVEVLTDLWVGGLGVGGSGVGEPGVDELP